MGRYFGTDGIRGVANLELTCELAMNAARAAASFFKNNNAPLFIGRDTRISGTMLESAFVAGALSVGKNVFSAGIIPTPAVSFLTRELACSFGVVISASHNPVGDNGIKLFSGDGYKLPDSSELLIEGMINSGWNGLPVETGVGNLQLFDSAPRRYVEHVKKSVNCDLSGLKIAIDCACGAGFDVAPKILRDLGAQVLAINTEPDGARINVKCGSTDMAALAGLTVENECHLGIALDGDADRCLMVDEKGNKIDGDQILALLALYMKELELAGSGKLVVTVMSNLGLELAMREHGIELLRTSVGDRYVIEKMRECGALVGGEQSGHIILQSFNTTGDGPLTAAFVASVLKKNGGKFSELARIFTPLPQVLLNVKASRKKDFTEDRFITAKIAEYEKSFDGKGRILVRPSGTEPLIRVMVEGENDEKINSAARTLASLIEERLN